jgi:predicted oxidoreductase
MNVLSNFKQLAHPSHSGRNIWAKLMIPTKSWTHISNKVEISLTRPTYTQGEESEKAIGDWMEKRGNRDQMVIATKYSSAFRVHARATEPIQTNLLGNSKKSMHVSVNASLKKLKTDYIDILYVHW